MGRLSFVEIVLVNGGGVESTDESGATGVTSLPLSSLVSLRGSGVWRWSIRCLRSGTLVLLSVTTGSIMMTC